MTGATMCSGIGAPETAAPGVQWLWSAEVERFPSRVLAHRHSGSMNLGDITAADFIDRAEAFGHLNLLVAGTPCQAFSVAGNRRSLEDARGNLTLRFVEVVDAIEPDAVLWENVPGVLSTKDNAFGCFLAALVGADDAIVPERGWTNAGMVSGPRRNAAWRVLDAQYFGLAQRRKRVFVLACPRNGADPREILFECEGVPKHSPPRREAGEIASPDVAERAGIGFEVGPGGGRDVDVACTMDARAKDGAIWNQVGMLAMSPIGLDEEQNATVDFFGTLKARQEGGGFEGSVFVPQTAQTLRTETGRCQIETNYVSHCLNAGTFQNTGHGWWNESPVAQTIRTPDGSGSMEANVEAVVSHGSFGVRRLTPRECERLQGFPDDFSALDKAADGPRYKALGNSMAVPCVAFICDRIKRAIETWDNKENSRRTSGGLNLK
jgi:DNA (cytosine-5)-methyltransferase 1